MIKYAAALCEPATYPPKTESAQEHCEAHKDRQLVPLESPVATARLVYHHFVESCGDFGKATRGKWVTSVSSRASLREKR